MIVEPLVIDGSMGEGGGQILRTSLALSAVLGRPVKIINIRAKRSNPGLQRQHLAAVRVLAQLSGARVKGASVGSTELEFHPTSLRSGYIEIDIGTAGSVTLVFQAIMPVLAFLPGETTLTVRGGTDVPWSPTIDYLANVVLWHLEKMGLKASVEIHRRGYYPKGGGRVTYHIYDPPGMLKPISLTESGEIISIEGRSLACNLPTHVAERQARSAALVIKRRLDSSLPINIRVDHCTTSALGPGSSIAIWANTRNSRLGSDSLGAKGKPAEKVGEEAGTKLVEDLSTRAGLDRHMSDMIIPLLALASGVSRVRGSRLTLHALTNLEVVKLVLGSVATRLQGREGDSFELEVRGIGLQKGRR